MIVEPEQLTISDEGALRQLAEKVGQEVRPGDILLLYGELGAGKTTFTQYLARGLGVQDHVTSPTFTIAAEYDVGGEGAVRRFIHMDLYRLEKVEGEDLRVVQDVMESARQQKALVVIEWADRLGEAVPREAWKVQFTHGQMAAERVITIDRI